MSNSIQELITLLTDIADKFAKADPSEILLPCLLDDIRALLELIVEHDDLPPLMLESIEYSMLKTLNILNFYIKEICEEARQPFSDIIIKLKDIFHEVPGISADFFGEIKKIITDNESPSVFSTVGSMLVSVISIPGSARIIDLNRKKRFKTKPPADFQKQFKAVRYYTEQVIRHCNAIYIYQQSLLEVCEQNKKCMYYALNNLRSTPLTARDVALLLKVRASLEIQMETDKKYGLSVQTITLSSSPITSISSSSSCSSSSSVVTQESKCSKPFKIDYFSSIQFILRDVFKKISPHLLTEAERINSAEPEVIEQKNEMQLFRYKEQSCAYGLIGIDNPANRTTAVSTNPLISSSSSSSSSFMPQPTTSSQSSSFDILVASMPARIHDELSIAIANEAQTSLCQKRTSSKLKDKDGKQAKTTSHTLSMSM